MEDGAKEPIATRVLLDDAHEPADVPVQLDDAHEPDDDHEPAADRVLLMERLNRRFGGIPTAIPALAPPTLPGEWSLINADSQQYYHRTAETHFSTDAMDFTSSRASDRESIFPPTGSVHTP